MMEVSSLANGRVAAFGAILALGAGVGGYAIHEHNAAQNLATTNQQATAQLNATQHALSDLTAKVNTLETRNEAQQAAVAAQQASAAPAAAARRPGAGHVQREDPRFKKLQAQLDAQGKAIDQTRNDLTGTQGDLVNTRTELTGSIAHTHDELVVLEKRGERNYTEFDLSKSKEFKRAGVISIRLRKANNKHQYADLELLVDDRNLSQKHVNLYQPVMYSTPDSPQPVEVVINEVSKDHIHGYVSAPKYRQSELASMSSANDNNGNQATNGGQPAPTRQKLPPPQ